ncbi:hypothetical protein [Streptomyces sp. NPDC047043]|uniref:hypothetical protein n=1 Tax=Streptomyces sp. NPDC047043 TaxID=3154497 RepID=UPI0033E98930
MPALLLPTSRSPHLPWRWWVLPVFCLGRLIVVTANTSLVVAACDHAVGVRRARVIAVLPGRKAAGKHRQEEPVAETDKDEEYADSAE